MSRSSADLQQAFADYCRTGDWKPIPGVRKERAEVYRQLIFSNMHECFSNLLPLSKRAVGDEEWREMIADFIAEHRAQSPQLWRLPFEFVAFVCEEGHARLPYLSDLMRFEALDHEVNLMADVPAPPFTRVGDPLEDSLVLNPEHRFAHFTYPVFKTSEFEGTEGHYYLMLFRHPETLRVRLIELSAFYLAVLELLREEPQSGKEGLERAAHHFGGLEEEKMLAHGRSFFEMLLNQGALLGYGQGGEE